MRYFLYLFFIASSAQASVNDVLPADYFPLATGTTTLAIYAYDRQSEGPYGMGEKRLDGQMDTQIMALRATHFMMLSDVPVSLIVTVPWSQTAVSPARLAGAIGETVHGQGDIRFGATGWLLARRESAEYFAVTGLLFLPTGNYNNRQVLNVGENRYKFTLNAGWIHPLGRSFIFETIPEIAWFGDNRDYAGGRTLSQDPAYALTYYLRYRANSSWQFYFGQQINRGGDARINGADQKNAPDNSRAMLGASFLTDDKKNQWMLRLAKDTAINNGFAVTSELLLRYLKIF